MSNQKTDKIIYITYYQDLPKTAWRYEIINIITKYGINLKTNEKFTVRDDIEEWLKITTGIKIYTNYKEFLSKYFEEIL